MSIARAPKTCMLFYCLYSQQACAFHLEPHKIICLQKVIPNTGRDRQLQITNFFLTNASKAVTVWKR